MSGWLARLRGTQSSGPEGVAVRVHKRPRSESGSGSLLSGRFRRRRTGKEKRIPFLLLVGVALAAAFYVVAHLAILEGVWPVHGSASGAGALLVRDAVALAAWLLLLFGLRALGFRGNWAVVALPIIIFCIARPALFSVFTDPVYQAGSGARTEANAVKADRSRISTIERAYTPERQAIIFDGEAPPLPDPFEQVAAETQGAWTPVRLLSHASVFLAPLALLFGFLWARDGGELRRFREHKRGPFVATLGVFFLLTLFFTELGKVRGTTPWELLLPIFVLVWAATLAEDAYNFARPGAVIEPRRIAGMLIYGALPVVPFLIIRELGLSIVLAGSFAIMLLVGTRRGWWAGLMLGVWIVLVIAAFNLDARSATRLRLAYEPYPELSEMDDASAARWGASNYQIKLFDANVLAGGLLGKGPGRGHAETAPNAADDGYITLLAAQYGWFGTLTFVLIYTLFLVQMIGVAVREAGAFERSAVIGLALLIGIPFWLATLGGLRVIPLTGVAAAFAAHGGAKLLASSLAVGIVAGISHRRRADERLESVIFAPATVPSLEGVRVR